MFNLKQRKAFIIKASKKSVDYLLGLNVNNRTVKKRHVEWIKNAIIEKDFVLTGQSISVSRDGALQDGQHRLLAIREAGYPPVELLLITGLDAKAQLYVDQHAKRTMADMLKINLNKNVTPKMAAVATLLLRLKERHGVFSSGGVRPSVKRVYALMTGIREDIEEISEACGMKVRTGAVAAIYHYSQKAGISKAVAFAIQVRDGENISKNDPAYKLRKYLDAHRSHGGSQMLETYRMTVSACIAHCNNRKLEALRPSNSWAELGRERNKEEGNVVHLKKSA